MSGSSWFWAGVVVAGVMAVALSSIKEPPPVWHPATVARVTAKTQYVHRDGPASLSLSFAAGDYHNRVYVDLSTFERVRHWDCISVQFDETSRSWGFRGMSQGCAP